MPSSPLQMPSPCSTELGRDNGAPLERKGITSAVRMLKINSLLNPSASEHSRTIKKASISPPPTPAYTQASSAPSTPFPQTPTTPSPKRQKLIKDAAVFVRGMPKEPVNFTPYECTENSVCLSNQQQEELARQQRRFNVSPNGRGNNGFIADYQRHIPYSSEKKTFYGKTNRDAFEVFQYTFRMPEEPDKEHVVMWDYQVGLVRITPFFKALKWTKTTPAKALTVNPGLKELSHSITGGALVAQGYWMPYSCARAICLTFCYPIRWALTPIFGPSFIKECLRPDHPSYCRFKINSEVVRCAQLESQGLRVGRVSRSGTPATDVDVYGGCHPQKMPRSVQTPAPIPMQPRVRKDQPSYKLGSPFESDREATHDHYGRGAIAFESPDVSPKTTRHYTPPTWTSINRQQIMDTPPPAPENTPADSLSRSLLTEPRSVPTTSWRGLGAADAVFKSTGVSTDAHNKQQIHERRISIDERTGDELIDASPVDSCGEDETDIAICPAGKARKHLEGTSMPSERKNQKLAQMKPARSPKYSTKYTAADARAAQWLLNLSARDSQLAQASGQMRGQKRRASSVL